VLLGVLGGLLAQRILGLTLEAPRRLFRTVSIPFFAPFQAARVTTGTVTGQFQEVEALLARIHELEQQLAVARLEARLGDEARLEAERLKQALAVRGETRDRLPTDPLFAHVVGASPHPHERRITLDRGSRHGVTLDSPVIYGDDVLGRVIQVLPSTSRVLLVQDPLSALGVLLEGERAPGVAQGLGGPHLELSGLPADVRLVAGTRVLTGSLSAYYPKGLVVGILEELDGRWLVRPRRDPFRLEEAFILPLGAGDTSASAPPGESA
jgi:rod shape-determining protein MreC